MRVSVVWEGRVNPPRGARKKLCVCVCARARARARARACVCVCVCVQLSRPDTAVSPVDGAVFAWGLVYEW